MKKRLIDEKKTLIEEIEEKENIHKESGKSFTGDQHLVRVNPGEMVLSKDQQNRIKL